VKPLALEDFCKLKKINNTFFAYLAWIFALKLFHESRQTIINNSVVARDAAFS